MGALALVTLAATTKVLRARPSSLPCKQGGCSGVNAAEHSLLTTKLELHPEEQRDAKELEHNLRRRQVPAVLWEVVLQAGRQGDERHGAGEGVLVDEDLQKCKCPRLSSDVTSSSKVLQRSTHHV